MDFEFLSKSILFSGTTPEDIKNMLTCLGAEERHFKKDAIIYNLGDTVKTMGLVLSGSVNIEYDDIWGNRSILNHIAKGEIFAEAYACIPNEPLMINVSSAEDSSILFLNTERLLSVCPNACPFHNKIIKNLLAVTSQKNLRLSQRILHTSPKSIRGRLIAYLTYQATLNGSYKFTIPFNRQQLADYLNVDRSALSNELSKMQKDGLLTVKKNLFQLNISSFS